MQGVPINKFSLPATLPSPAVWIDRNFLLPAPGGGNTIARSGKERVSNTAFELSGINTGDGSFKYGASTASAFIFAATNGTITWPNYNVQMGPAITMFAVVQWVSANANVLFSSNAGQFYWNINTTGTLSAGNGTANQTSTTALTSGETSTVGWTCAGASSPVQFYINGVADNSGGTYTLSGLSVVSFGDVVTSVNDGTSLFAEAIMFNAGLSSAQMLALHRYAVAKWFP